MKLTACDCRAAHYQRVKRSPWMKVVLGRKLYHCHACDQLMLLDPGGVEQRMRKERRRDPRPAQAREAALRGS